MRLGRLLIVLAIVVILGLVAVYALLNLGGGGQDPGGAVPTTNIVMVVQPIGRGGVITAEALGYLAYPTDQTIEGMFTNVDQAVGLRARYDLEPGVPLTANMVVETADQISDTGSDTALLIPSGMVSFPIPIDRFSSLAYGLRSGDHVNVIATMLLVDLNQNFQTMEPDNTAGVLAPGPYILTSPQTGDNTTSQVTIDQLLNALTAQIASGGASSPEGEAVIDPVLGQPIYTVPSEPEQRPRLVSQTLLQNIVVLHVGDFLYTDPEGNEVQPQSSTIDATGQQIPVSASPPDLITLIITPQDAVTLNWLIYAGADLTLALRAAGDDSVVTTEAVTLEYLLTSYDIPVPSKLPYGLAPRVDSLNSPTQQDTFPPLPSP